MEWGLPAEIAVSNEGEGFIVISKPQGVYKISPLCTSALDKLYRFLLEKGINRKAAYDALKEIEKDFGLTNEWYTGWPRKGESKLVRVTE